MDIHTCITETDIKEWPSKMQELYEAYVKDQQIKQKNQDKKSIQEMVNQISHLD